MYWRYRHCFVLFQDHFIESLVCDILCSLDTFLLALPMYLLVGLAVHMFTRFPSPQIGRVRRARTTFSCSKVLEYAYFGFGEP